jgi:hypothetical protein
MVQHLYKRFATCALALLALGASGWALADPPSRVARLAFESGLVTFSPAGDDEWARAPLNRPLGSGDRLWIDADARAELEIGGAALRLGDNTSASLLNLDDRIVQLRLTQGKASIHVWRIASGQTIEIDTPNLAYVIRRPGTYRIDVDANDGWTAVAARGGEADVYGDGASFRLRAGDGYRFWDTALGDYERFAVGPPDALDRWASTRDRRWEHSVSARYVPRELIGSQDLDEYGRWRDEPGYGHVWVPARVEAGWAPYRDGHWSWVEPWGWTWVDDAPWGFACSHYGRWANFHGQWAWVPGPVNVQAVYAPALVAFVGGSDFRLAFGSGSAPAVAWFPLAPREVYRPAYQVSREYFTRVNTSNTVVNVTRITNVYNTTNVTNVVYANQRVPGAVVAMPAQAFVQSHPVAKDSVRMQPQQIANVHAVPVAPLAPVRTSFLGAQPAARHPPEAAMQRAVVARTPPPPRPAPVSERVAALAAHPGRPLAPAAATAAAAAPAAAASARAQPAPVKIVQAPSATAALPSAPPPPAPGARAGEHHRPGAAAAASSPAPAGSAAATPRAAAPSRSASTPPAAGPRAPAPGAATPAPATPPARTAASAPANRHEPPAARGEAPRTPAAPPPARASEPGRASAVPPPASTSSAPRVESPRVREEARQRPEAPRSAPPAAVHAPEPAAPAARQERERAAAPAAAPAPAAPAARTPSEQREPPHAAPPERRPAPEQRAAQPEARPAPPAAPARAEAPPARAEPPHPAPPPHAAPPEAKAPPRAEPPHAAPPPPAAPPEAKAPPPRAEPPHPAAPPPRAAAPEPKAPPPRAEPPHPAPPAPAAAPEAKTPPPRGEPREPAGGRREHASEPHGTR